MHPIPLPANAGSEVGGEPTGFSLSKLAASARTSVIGTLVTLPAASLTTFARLADLGVIKALPVLAYGE